jgi:hypothetical protein
MGNVGGHIAILGVAGVAAGLVSFGLDQARRAETASLADAPVVVSVPQRAPAPMAAPAPQRPAATPPPGDPTALARQLQSELKRVGCYDGEINGVWTTSTRLAMRAFTDRVNASLPIDRPDAILLALVQGHRDKTCGAPCPDGQTPQRDGRCQPSAIPVKASPKPVGAETSVETKSVPAAAIAAVPPQLVSPPTEIRRASPLPPTAERGPESATASAGTTPPAPLAPPPRPVPAERPQRVVDQQAGPVPAVGVYDRRVARSARRTASRQIRYVRAFLRSLQRATTVPLGLP